MTDFLHSLGILESAQIVEHLAGQGDGISWLETLSRLPTLIDGMPVATGVRRVYGIQADNSVETIHRILAIISVGHIPAPFPPGIGPQVVVGCLTSLGAVGVWFEETGWSTLGGDVQHCKGFELVMHSSGSTGVPKPLAIRLPAMRKNALDVAAALSLTAKDVHLGTMSQCYMSGFYNATILPLVTGGISVSLPITTPMTLGALLAAVEKHQPSVLWVSPLVARMLATIRGVSAETLSPLRFAISCTAPLHESIKARFEDRFGVPLLQSYGLCETLITTIEAPDHPVAGGVGRAIGQDGAVTISPDGEIIVSNGAHFSGYITENGKHEIKSVDTYKTGDTGFIDDDGNLFVTGRLSEVINVNGVKFSPESIENTINDLSSVTESAVVAYETKNLQMRIIAIVVGDAVAKNKILEYLHERLPSVQIPHEIKIVDSLPRTANGKIDRPALRRSESV